MGPSAWHTDPAGLAARVAALAEPVRVTLAVRLTTWHPAQG
jgi:23S rRNA (guanine745-N1)-methyltransferase